MYTTCLKIGCHKLAKQPNKYCEDHQHIESEKKTERNRHYDSVQRNQRSRVFYNSPEWKATRKHRLIVDGGLCQECLRAGKIKPACHVHHIIELEEDWDKRLEVSNLESVCKSCHNKHKEGKRIKKG